MTPFPARTQIASVAALISGLLATVPASAGFPPEGSDLTTPYLGQTPPGATPELFAPGLLSTALHDDGPARFDADGTQVWFRKWAVPHDIVGVMRLEGGSWTEPRMFRPLGRYVAGVPIFAPDGRSAFFISRAPLSGEGEPADYNVWTASYADGGFGELTPLGPTVNTPDNEYLHSVAANGTLYFQAKRDDTLGGYDFYACELIDGEYQPAVNLGAPLNTEHSESAPYVAPDESFLVYCVLGHPESLGGIDLFVSFRQDDGSWGAGVNLGPEVNTPFDEKFPALSLDGQYLFFVGNQRPERSYVFTDLSYDEAMRRNLSPQNGEGDVYWVDAAVIQAVRP